ncbi:MAG: hypothetical protein WD602_03075 [Actinomycetota bacterium]
MGFLERKLQEGEDQAGRVINGYRQLLDDSEETASIKAMITSGSPADSAGRRAADVHRALFKTALADPGVKYVAKSKTRSGVVEQFCVALWRKHLGEDDEGYRAMIIELGIVQSK